MQRGQDVPDQVPSLPSIPGTLAKHRAPPLGPIGTVPENPVDKHSGTPRTHE